MIHPKKKVCASAHVPCVRLLLVLVCRIMYHIRTYLSSAPKIRICRYVCTRATSPPPKKEQKAQRRLRERHTHSATVIAQQGACNNYGQRYRGCTCCLMDTESLMIRRRLGRLTQTRSVRQSFTQSADADGSGKLAITLLLLLKLLENYYAAAVAEIT